MSFFDYWRALHSILEERTLPATTQLVGYKILAVFNEARFPAEMTLADRQLQNLCQIKSLKSIHDAKALLKQAGFIDFENRKNKPTVYRLHQVNAQVNTKETPSKREVNAESAPINRAYVDILDVTDIEDKTTTTTATARAREDGWNSRAVQEMWFKCTGGQIPGAMTYALYELEQFHGTDALCKAILTAAQENKYDRLTLNFLRAVLRNQKGDEGNARTFSNTGAIPSWADLPPDE